MTQLLGEFECKLDSKGRLMIPAGLKRQVPFIETEGLIIARGMEKNLKIYTRDVWGKIAERVSGLDDFDPKARTFKRMFLRGAAEAMLDAAGRVLIPKNLQSYAEVSSDVVLVCVFDHVELWSKDEYDAQFSDDAAAFALLAQEVMKTEKGGADGV